MFLRELHVEHLRTVRQARLRLDASTTLIGENDCGKGSLIRALELVLGRGDAARVTPADFHRDGRLGDAHLEGAPGRPLRVGLVFEERAPGEWDVPWHAPLRPHLRPSGGRCRLLRLEASATAPGGGRPAELALRVEGVRERAAQRAVVEHVRAMSPLIRVAGGLLEGRAGEDAQRTLDRLDAARAPARLAGLVARILGAADDLLSGAAIDPEDAVDDGARAARALLAESPRHFDPAGAGLASFVLEILGGPPAPLGVAAFGSAALPPTFADRLGTLLLVAAVLRHMPAGLAPGVEPLWIIEDPEAHLHPMTLASAERTLEHVRWQKIVTTQSGDLLAAVPLAQVRRLVRHDGRVRAAGLRPRALSREHLRRIGYHLRGQRGVAMFARVWLLVEGESEFWILPQVAQVLGHDLALEGICCVGFAQCGLDPLVRTAREFGIEWHLLADGDDAGRRYAAAARAFARRGEERERITLLAERDIEHCFWQHGHADAILRVAGVPPGADVRMTARHAIGKAVERRSKPYLALSLVESVARSGPGSVPAPLARLVETCVALARGAPSRAVAGP